MLKVGIAGAGIGGLTAAALLARGGAEVALFDQYAAPQPLGSGLVIQPVGGWVLGQAGALEAARGWACAIHRMSGREVERNRVVLEVSYARKGGQTAFGPAEGLAIHRAALFQAVWDAAAAAGARVELDAAVTGTTLEADGTRWLTRADGQRDGPFDLVVDASGAGSPLSPLKATPLPYGAIWGTVDWPEGTDLPADELSQRYFRASRMAGVLPIGRMPGGTRDLAAVFWSLPVEAYDAWADAPLGDWRDEAIALWPAMAPFVEQITTHEQMTMARYSHGTLRNPIADRLVYIGDAAHRASPQLGQGANMALLDAFALARAVASGPVETALERYAASRRWHVGIYQAMSWAFTPQYQSDSQVLPWLRDWFLMPLSQIPPLPRVLSRLVSGDMVPPVAGQPYAAGKPQGLVD